MLAITGQLDRRMELLALAVTTMAAVTVVIAPVLYVLLVPGACLAVAALAPRGRRLPAAVAAWVPVSLGVLLATTPVLG